MTDQWNEGGGGFNGNETTSDQSGKSATRQQFLCPVTARQVLEADIDGVKLGSRRATMVKLVGIVTDIEKSSTSIKFNLSDDTGLVGCLEWIEADDEIKKHKEVSNLQEQTYYQVHGCVKNAHGSNKVMVFKTVKVTDFNEVTAFLMEILCASTYKDKEAKGDSRGYFDKPQQFSRNEYNSFLTSTYENQAFTPVQKAVLDAIKGVGTQVGWSKYDPEIRKTFSAKQIQDALDFLVGEGHIYTTVDDDHFCST